MRKKRYSGKGFEDFVLSRLSSDELETSKMVSEEIARDNSSWAFNASANRCFVKPDNQVSVLFNMWKNKKCLVVGAGMSVRREIGPIRLLQQDGYKIIACDRMFGFLRSNDVKPDLTISCDATERVGLFFERLDNEDAVVLSVQQHPSFVKAAVETTENVFFYYSINRFCPIANGIEHEYDECFKESGILAHLLVGFNAVQLAYAMGCKKIVLIGNELCWFHKEEIDRCYVEQHKISADEPRILIGKTKNGELTWWSIGEFIDAANAFNDVAKFFNDAEWIDASGGLIYNMKKMTLSEVSKSERKAKWIWEKYATG